MCKSVLLIRSFHLTTLCFNAWKSIFKRKCLDWQIIFWQTFGVELSCSGPYVCEYHGIINSCSPLRSPSGELISSCTAVVSTQDIHPHYLLSNFSYHPPFPVDFSFLLISCLDNFTILTSLALFTHHWFFITLSTFEQSQILCIAFWMLPQLKSGRWSPAAPAAFSWEKQQVGGLSAVQHTYNSGTVLEGGISLVCRSVLW